MSSYFNLTLDTTAPTIEIYAPTYTSLGVLNEIKIESNEQLDNFQEIYVIDSVGARTDYTFSFNGNELDGAVQFNNMASGVATFYVTLRDTVGNTTTASKLIQIYPSGTLNNGDINVATVILNTSESVANMLTLEFVTQMDSSDFPVVKMTKSEVAL